MKYQKITRSILLSALVSSGLIACNADNDSQTQTANDTAQEKPAETISDAKPTDTAAEAKPTENSDTKNAAKTEPADAEKPYHKALVESYKPEKVAEHTYVIHGPKELPTPENQGFMNNPGFVVAETAVAVIDPGSSVQIGRALLKHIRTITDKPITHVFNSHIHGDHWLGNQAFVEENADVLIYAHPAMIKAAESGAAEQWIDLLNNMTEKAIEGTEAAIPAKSLTDGEIVQVGNLSIKAHLNEHAHTKTDAMYEVVEDKTLFTGDNVTHMRIPRMDDGSFRGSISVIEKAIANGYEHIVPGHGPSGGIEVLQKYQSYLADAYGTASALREEGMEDFEMKDQVVEKLADFKDWPGFSDEIGKHISLIVLEAEQAEFE